MSGMRQRDALQKTRGSSPDGLGRWRFLRVSLTERVQGSRLNAAPLPAAVANREQLLHFFNSQSARADSIPNGLVRLAFESGLLCSAVRCHENASNYHALDIGHGVALQGKPRKSVPFRCQVGHGAPERLQLVPETTFPAMNVMFPAHCLPSLFHCGCFKPSVDNSTLLHRHTRA